MRLKGKFATGVLTFSLVTFSGSAMAFAQATNSPTPPSSSKTTEAHGQGAHTADHGMSSNKGAGVMVGKQDEEFLIKAAQGEIAEIEAARLAQEKATSGELKEFARKLEQDHSKASDELKTLAASKNVDLPADAGTHKSSVDKIREKSGDDFDKAFMKMQVSHHKKDVKAFQKQTERAMDSDVRAFATATLPTLQDHLRQAEELQASTRGRKAPDKPEEPEERAPTAPTPSPSPSPSIDPSPTPTPSPANP